MDRSEVEMRTFEDNAEDVTIDLKAEVAATEERRQSVWQAIRKEPCVVFWCLFFAFSAVGW